MTSAGHATSLAELVDPVGTWNPTRRPPEESFVYVDLAAVNQELKTISGAWRVSCADAPSRARQLLRKGDVLVSTVRPNLNAVAEVPSELDGATGSTGFCVLRPRAKSIDSRYLFHWVRTSEFVAVMVKEATGANYPTVSDRIVLESRIPVPSIEQRRLFASRVAAIRGLWLTKNLSLKALDELFASLQHQAFNGEL